MMWKGSWVSTMIHKLFVRINTNDAVPNADEMGDISSAAYQANCSKENRCPMAMCKTVHHQPTHWPKKFKIEPFLTFWKKSFQKLEIHSCQKVRLWHLDIASLQPWQPYHDLPQFHGWSCQPPGNVWTVFWKKSCGRDSASFARSRSFSTSWASSSLQPIWAILPMQSLSDRNCLIFNEWDRIIIQDQTRRSRSFDIAILCLSANCFGWCIGFVMLCVRFYIPVFDLIRTSLKPTAQSKKCELVPKVGLDHSGCVFRIFSKSDQCNNFPNHVMRPRLLAEQHLRTLFQTPKSRYVDIHLQYVHFLKKLTLGPARLENMLIFARDPQKWSCNELHLLLLLFGELLRLIFILWCDLLIIAQAKLGKLEDISIPKTSKNTSNGRTVSRTVAKIQPTLQFRTSWVVVPWNPLTQTNRSHPINTSSLSQTFSGLTIEDLDLRTKKSGL